ncbi:hypothetical protein [Streptomyces sp. NPDC090131]|uniref:hypothetical protein n=1 Tax=Streptomyces sp. NPDC090131 TaxID=3365954 RepID=UPI0037FF2DF7
MTGDGRTAECMALPGSTEDRREVFARSLTGVIRVLGIEVAPEPEPADGRTWAHRARAEFPAAADDGPDPVPEWHEAALREFVRNEHLDAEPFGVDLDTGGL